MSLFGTAQGWGGRQKASLRSVTYILQCWNLAKLYLTQRRSGNYMNHVTHLLIHLTSWHISDQALRKFLYKILLDSALNWHRVWLAINKNRNIFHYKATNFLKIWLFFLVFTKGQQKDKNQFVTKFIRIIITITFI